MPNSLNLTIIVLVIIKNSSIILSSYCFCGFLCNFLIECFNFVSYESCYLLLRHNQLVFSHADWFREAVKRKFDFYVVFLCT